MRVLPVIYAVLFIGTCASAQNHKAAVGIDIGRLIRTEVAEVSASYGTPGRWTAIWAVGFETGDIPRKENKEYLEHLSEFEAVQKKQEYPASYGFGAQYWPRSIYEGPYLEAGIRCSKDGKADWHLGFGYCIPIWQQIRAVISYGTEDVLSIGVYWVFETNKNE